ncbi:MAG TPA: hypothetical protein P5572_20580, partial [Phycisphaerae bacterium]|nr:hypothetical protein [Phycisphaerae bacterium]
SQVVMSAFYNPFREWQLRRQGIEVTLRGDIESMAGEETITAEDRRSVFVGRLMVLFWGVVLCLMAYLAKYVAAHYKSILDLGLAMVGYTQGALLAGFALAFLPLRIDGRGYMWSGPLSAVCVFATVWHKPWSHLTCWIAAGIFVVLWGVQLSLDRGDPQRRPYRLGAAARTLIFLSGLGLMVLLSYHGFWWSTNDAGEAVRMTVSWPWYAPIGSTIAFIWGYLLAGRKETEPRP